MNDQSSTQWAALYKEVLKQIKIPAIASTDYSGTRITVRGMLVDLKDVYDKVHKQGLEPDLVSVYADVVKISDDALVNETALLIGARRIEVDPGAQVLMDFRDGQLGKLLVFAHEITGKLQVKAVTSTEHRPEVEIFDLSSPETVGTMVFHSANAPVKRSIETIDDKGLELGAPMRLSLAAIFQFATALFYSDPDTARSMLSWIQAATNGSKAALDLYLQSSALLTQLNASTSVVTFVPYLDKDVYASVAGAFLDAAQAHEEQYQRFSDKEQDIKDRTEAAGLMLKHYQDTTHLHEQLIRQAESNLRGAEHAANQAEASFKIQQSKVRTAGIGFKFQSKIWVREQIIEAVFKMCFALVEFAAAIGLMAVGDEAAGAQAGAAIGEGVKAAQQAEKVSQDLGEVVVEINEMTQTMKDLAHAMEKLKGAGEALQKTYGAINRIVAACKDIGKAKMTADVAIPPTDDIAAQAEWDAFLIEVHDLLRPAVSAPKPIPGAQAYQNELDKLAIYGKAYMASQVAVVQVGQEVARLYLQKQVSADQEKRLGEYIEKLEAQPELDEALMQMFFERELNIKRWLFIALQNYTWAYRYWALQDSRVQLSIVRPVQELREDLGTIKQEYADALNSFNPGTQTLPRRMISIPDTDQGPYKNIVAELRDTGSTTFAFDLADPAFDGHGRVRLSSICVWLEGVQASEAHPLYIDITNSGIYADRLHGRTFHFASSPLERVFQYAGSPGDDDRIIVGGEVADREKFAYFEPTPFTQWTVRVPPKHNRGIDLSTLTSITIEFAGSVIPMPD